MCKLSHSLEPHHFDPDAVDPMELIKMANEGEKTPHCKSYCRTGECAVGPECPNKHVLSVQFFSSSEQNRLSTYFNTTGV